MQWSFVLVNSHGDWFALAVLFFRIPGGMNKWVLSGQRASTQLDRVKRFEWVCELRRTDSGIWSQCGQSWSVCVKHLSIHNGEKIAGILMRNFHTGQSSPALGAAQVMNCFVHFFLFLFGLSPGFVCARPLGKLVSRTACSQCAQTSIEIVSWNERLWSSSFLWVTEIHSCPSSPRFPLESVENVTSSVLFLFPLYRSSVSTWLFVPQVLLGNLPTTQMSWNKRTKPFELVVQVNALTGCIYHGTMNKQFIVNKNNVWKCSLFFTFSWKLDSSLMDSWKWPSSSPSAVGLWCAPCQYGGPGRYRSPHIISPVYCHMHTQV